MNCLVIVSIIICVGLVKTAKIPEGYYYGSGGQAIVTKWPTGGTTRKPLEAAVNPSETPGNDSGWLRSLLLKFGKMASKIGNRMGGHANKISAALDKICEVVKTVIPLLAAVCHVGEFGFCTATNEAPLKLAEAMNPNDLNLDSLDR